MINLLILSHILDKKYNPRTRTLCLCKFLLLCLSYHCVYICAQIRIQYYLIFTHNSFTHIPTGFKPLLHSFNAVLSFPRTISFFLAALPRNRNARFASPFIADSLRRHQTHVRFALHESRTFFIFLPLA